MRRVLVICALLPLGLQAGEEPEPPLALPIAPAVQPVSAAPAVQKLAAAKSPRAAAPYDIHPYEARYEVRYGGLKVGEMTQQLTAPVNGRQTLQTIAHTTGLVSWLKNDTITERSIWREQGGEVQPLSYTYRYTGRSKDAFERLDFDWQAGVVKSLRDGKVTELEVERGTLDKHLNQLVLRQDLLHGRRQLSYPVADRNKLQQYEFAVVGEESLQNEQFGTLDCLKVSKGTTLIWVAKQLDYLPVKIEKDEDGTLVSSNLLEYNSD